MAVQAVVVGVLMVVVFVTLLQPQNNGPLTGIQSPGGPASGLPGPDVYTNAPHHHHHPGGPNGHPGGGTRPSGPAGGPATPGAGPGPGSAPTTPGPTGGAPVTPAAPGGGPQGGGGGEGTPSDHQYADTLTRIVTRLN